MKKFVVVAASVVLVLVLLIVGALFAAPLLIDLNDHKPRIAEAVRDATGRELEIGGDIEYSLLPNLEFALGDVRLSNAPGAAEPTMLSVVGLSGKIAVFPLIGRNLVVERLVVTEPRVILEVDEAGRPNWVFEAQQQKELKEKPRRDRAESRAEDDDGGLPIKGLRLGEVRVEKGQLTYRDATTGQTVAAGDIDVTVALADLDSPFAMTARMTVNDEPVSFDLSLDTPGALLAGARAAAKAALVTPRATAEYDGGLRQQPVPGLDGTFALEVPSVGALAAWLGRPLDAAQPDPGPLKVAARFTGEGAKVVLEQATIEGAALQATASGSFDGSGEIATATLKVESGVLDIDRYLPPPAERDVQAAPRGKKKPRDRKRRDLLAAIPDEAIDLSALRRIEAGAEINIGGIKAVGFEIGRIAFTAGAKDGVLEARLNELQLYGGGVTGAATLDATGEALGVETGFEIAAVDLGALARAASRGEAPVAGVASGSLAAKAQGATPRALVETLSGRLAFDLGGVDIKDAPAGALSELKAKLELPGLASPPRLTASAVYNKERVTIEATLDPIDKILTGDAFAARATLASNLVTAAYAGTVVQEPAPGLDGTFDLDVTSLGELAAWLGQPLGKKQPDPGPLKLHAAIAADGPRMALTEATIEGKALKARASGSFDSSGSVPRVEAKLDLQEANLNKYLPRKKGRDWDAEPSGQSGAKPAKPEAGKWSEEPLDLSALSVADADVEIQLGKVRYRRLVAKQGLMTVKLTGGVLEAAIERLELAKGSIVGAATLDASTPVAAIDYRVTVDGVEARPLVRSFANSDRLSGTAYIETQGTARGASEKDIVTSLGGAGSFKFLNGAIHGFNLAKTLRNAGTLGLGDSTSAQTDFAEMSGSFTITKGVVRNQDFKMLAPLVRVNGAGKVPMPPRKVSYTVEAKLVGSLEGQGGQDSLKGLPIPVKVTGPWHKVKYKIDWKSVFLAAAADPTRLEAMPDSLKESAEGLGVALPIPGIEGGSDPVETVKKKKKKLKKKLKNLLGN